MVVQVVPYNLSWVKLFEKEASLIRKALGSHCTEIHHIGSTAIPGLSAKPIVDILPVVKDIYKVDAESMIALGYVSKGENGILFRRYFQKPGKYNVHIFEKGNPEIERHLKFRDWMRTHEEDAEAYGKLKIELTKKFPDNIMQYCLGKNDFIAAIDAKTGYRGTRIVEAVTDQEWDFIRKEGLKKDDRHLHLILYKETKIIGCAEIVLEDRQAKLTHLEAGQHQDLFLKELKRWMENILS